MPDQVGNHPLSRGAWIDKKSACVQPRDSFPVGSEITEECAREAGLDCFPNDLTRMLYLASLRDCNSGRYLHPSLSARIGTEMASQGLRACHLQIFWRLLPLPLSAYVSQLEGYICYSRTERMAVLQTWQSLQAYRATTPVLCSALYREVFCLNVESALLVLQTQAAVRESTP